LAQKKTIDALKAEKDALTEKKQAISDGYDEQIDLIDIAIKNIGYIEDASYATRLEKAIKFVSEYNAAMSALGGATGSVNVSSATSQSATAPDNIDRQNEIITEAQKQWNIAKEAGDVQGMKTAAEAAKTARESVLGTAGATSAWGTGKIDANGLLLHDNGGILPTGRAAINLSGKDEVTINDSQAGKLLTILRSLPQILSPNSGVSMAGAGGITINGDINLHLRQEIDHVFRAAIQLGVTLLPTEAFDLSNGNALHADLGQRLAYIVQLERLDDGSD